jgi:hypothetical protein
LVILLAIRLRKQDSGSVRYSVLWVACLFVTVAVLADLVHTRQEQIRFDYWAHRGMQYKPSVAWGLLK